VSLNLPHGVQLTPLDIHRDERGWLAEIFRDEWGAGMMPCQWNATMSQANVLRGMHVHCTHHDYLVVLQGRISVGLYDVRTRSQTYRTSSLFELSGEQQTAMRLPTGVIHGFYCHQPTLYVYGVDAYYDPDDEIGCRWCDPTLGIAWPCRDPMLSARDRDAGSVAELEMRLLAANAEFA